MIVDDALISGTTLVGMRLAIHDAAVALDRNIDVSIFVCVSRPSNSDNEKRVRLSVTRPARGAGELLTSGLHCGQKLLLPEECPWCEERELLGKLREGLEGPAAEFAERREKKLIPTPLQSPLLPLGGEGEGKIVGSFFGDLGPVCAFAAVSAHAQHLHERIEEVRVHETVKVLDVPFLLQAFFDPVIVAALLRTLPRRDLYDPAREHLVAREIRTNADSYYPATLTELALAALVLKVPAASVRAALEAGAPEEGWAHVYADLLSDY